MSVHDDIKSALEHAIEDRLGFLESLRNVTDMDDIRERTEGQIARWRKILKRRYGSSLTRHDRELAKCVLVEVKP